MITLPRDGVRAFRTALRKCSGDRSRGSAAVVAVHADGRDAVLRAEAGDATLQWTTGDPGGTGSLVLPADMLEEFEGGSDVVRFIPKPRNKVVAQWTERSRSLERTIDPPPGRPCGIEPALPEAWSEASPTLLPALHEAGRTAARVPGRYSLHRIQLRGAEGQIVGTDAQQALVQEGWTFPFPETLCVPAVPVFGAKELAGAPARIGRTPTHVVVRAGAWTVWLGIDADSRFPEVEAAIPKARGATTLTLAEADAVRLVEHLSRWKGRCGDSAPITIDVDANLIVVRGRETPDGPIVEAPLDTSKAAGLPMRITLERRYMLRALASGCRRFRFADPTRPFVGRSRSSTYLAAVLDPSEEIAPGPSRPVPAPPSPVPLENPMPPTNAPADTPPADLLAEAEQLRAAVLELSQRANRLVLLLRTKRREQRALDQVFTSLKSLQTGGSRR